MIALKPDGTIYSVNDNFSRLLFGYTRSQLVGESITLLIPDFFDVLDMELETSLVPVDFELDDDDDDVVQDPTTGKTEHLIKLNKG